jgi:hypothetical protein
MMLNHHHVDLDQLFNFLSHEMPDITPSVSILGWWWDDESSPRGLGSAVQLPVPRGAGVFSLK